MEAKPSTHPFSPLLHFPLSLSISFPLLLSWLSPLLQASWKEPPASRLGQTLYPEMRWERAQGRR